MSNLPLIFGLVMAVIYLPFSAQGVSWHRTVIKTLPLLSFVHVAFWGGGGVFLVSGLFLSALGDFALSREERGAFLYGLSAFALAHLAYILHFTELSDVPIWEAFVQAPVAAIGLVALMASSEVWLVPFTDTMRLPVRLYVLVIGAMGLAALSLPFGLAVLGAALFILSDLILALQLFRMPHTHPHHKLAGYAIWFLYIAGQGLLLLGGLGVVAPPIS